MESSGSTANRPRRRLRDVVSAPRRIWDTDFHIRAAALALDHWAKLEPQEQARFAELARAYAADRPLGPKEQKELTKLFKRLEVRPLVRRALAMATRRDGSTGES